MRMSTLAQALFTLSKSRWSADNESEVYFVEWWEIPMSSFSGSHQTMHTTLSGHARIPVLHNKKDYND